MEIKVDPVLLLVLGQPKSELGADYGEKCWILRCHCLFLPEAQVLA